MSSERRGALTAGVTQLRRCLAVGEEGGAEGAGEKAVGVEGGGMGVLDSRVRVAVNPSGKGGARESYVYIYNISRLKRARH